MTRYTRTEVVSGLFVMLAVLLFALYAFKAIKTDPLSALRPDPLRCVTEVSDVGGLDKGARVSVAGHEVGKVTRIEITQKPLSVDRVQSLTETFGPDAFPELEAGMTRQIAQVWFNITDPDLRIDPATARVSVRRDGLLGREFVALDPGYWSQDPPRSIDLPRDQPLRIASTKNLGMAELMAMVSPVMARANGFLANADRILSENRPRIKSLLANTDDMLEENRPRIRTLLEELSSTVHVAEEKIALVTDDAERLLALTSNILDENRAEITETIRRMRRSMWEAEMTLRKIRSNPSYLLFGDDEKLLNQAPYDSTWIRRSGRAQPFKQRDENDIK